MSFLNRREETSVSIFVVRIDENVSAIHERRVNIADADAVTVASKPQDALAAHRDERRYGHCRGENDVAQKQSARKCTTSEK